MPGFRFAGHPQEARRGRAVPAAQDAPFIRVRACVIVRSFHIRVKALLRQSAVSGRQSAVAVDGDSRQSTVDSRQSAVAVDGASRQSADCSLQSAVGSLQSAVCSLRGVTGIYSRRPAVIRREARRRDRRVTLAARAAGMRRSIRASGASNGSERHRIARRDLNEDAAHHMAQGERAGEPRSVHVGYKEEQEDGIRDQGSGGRRSAVGGRRSVGNRRSASTRIKEFFGSPIPDP